MTSRDVVTHFHQIINLLQHLVGTLDRLLVGSRQPGQNESVHVQVARHGLVLAAQPVVVLDSAAVPVHAVLPPRRRLGPVDGDVVEVRIRVDVQRRQVHGLGDRLGPVDREYVAVVAGDCHPHPVPRRQRN